MLVGLSIPLPVGAAVPYFHAAWVPLFVFGVFVSLRARPRSPQFALLIALCVFLLPVILTDEFFARRFLTSLVLVVALTGIGAYEAIRRLGEERNRRIRALVFLLTVGVVACNLWSYFVDYASMPKWKQGPFFASQRWCGPIVREHVDPDTKIIFAYNVEDFWTITLYLTDILDVRLDNPAFLRLPRSISDLRLDEVENFCTADVPIIFLFRIETPSEIVDYVMQGCGMTEMVPLPRQEGLFKRPDRRLMMAKRVRGREGEP